MKGCGFAHLRSVKIEGHLGAGCIEIFGWIDRINFRCWSMVDEAKLVQIIDSLFKVV